MNGQKYLTVTLNFARFMLIICNYAVFERLCFLPPIMLNNNYASTFVQDLTAATLVEHFQSISEQGGNFLYTR